MKLWPLPAEDETPLTELSQTQETLKLLTGRYMSFASEPTVFGHDLFQPDI
jgi:hypothetical protein